jgi:hypothetical protein
MDRIFKILPPKEPAQPNLEEIFTLLDLADQGSQILEAADVRWEVVRQCVIGMITEAFLWHEYEFEGSAPERGEDLPARVLDMWTALIRGTDTIITFNWDILHEAALWRAHKWHYADGYGFTCRDAPTGVHSPVTLLKLHGSVNWTQADEDDCQPFLEDKGNFFAPAPPRDNREMYRRGASSVNQGRYLIIPSYLKDVSANKLLLGLWNQASGAIEGATELVVIGFRLHPADTLARHLIGSSVLRNRGLSKITVVSPWGGAAYWGEFCRKLGRMEELYPMTFEEWLVKQGQHWGLPG